MHTSPTKLTIRSFANYNKKKAITMLFPYSTPKDVNVKFLITILSPKDRILHFALYRVIIPKIINLTHIVKGELFLMWLKTNWI